MANSSIVDSSFMPEMEGTKKSDKLRTSVAAHAGSLLLNRLKKASTTVAGQRPWPLLMPTVYWQQIKKLRVLGRSCNRMCSVAVVARSSRKDEKPVGEPFPVQNRVTTATKVEKVTQLQLHLLLPRDALNS